MAGKNPFRLAVPPALAESAALAVAAGGGSEVRLLVAPELSEPRARLAAQRLLLERRAGQGWSAPEADGALKDGSIRSALMVLNRDADAAWISESDTQWRAAWHLLGPRGNAACTDVYAGHGGSELGWEFAWLDWPGVEELSRSVDRLRTATAWLARAGGQAAFPVLVRFSGGKHPRRAATDKFAATMRARSELLEIELYSPLFYSQGRLNAAALLTAVRKAWSVSAFKDLGWPVLCIPELGHEEFEAGLRTAGGELSGAFRAGAEATVARLGTKVSPARAAATLAWTLRGR